MKHGKKAYHDWLPRKHTTNFLEYCIIKNSNSKKNVSFLGKFFFNLH
jgi:hypothetical protein